MFQWLLDPDSEFSIRNRCTAHPGLPTRRFLPLRATQIPGPYDAQKVMDIPQSPATIPGEEYLIPPHLVVCNPLHVLEMPTWVQGQARITVRVAISIQAAWKKELPD